MKHFTVRYIKLKIPVKTYVKKYLECKYPGEQKLSLNNVLGKLIYLCLEKENSHWRDEKINMEWQKYRLMTDEFTVLIPMNGSYLYSVGYTIPEAKSIFISNHFEEQMIHELHMMAVLSNKFGGTNSQAIEDFCEKYNIVIDVDVTFQAFKKAEYRYRLKILKNETQYAENFQN